MSPIGWVESVFKEKFGTPRQSGVVPSAQGVLHFYPPYHQPEAFEEIEGFSHLWLITQFHLVPEEGFRPKVRPPKLGGAQKVGVFASRAPYRPNRMALSVVRLEEVRETEAGVVLEVSGLDLVEGTPLLDVKPYLPYADSIPQAQTAYGLPAQAGLVYPESAAVYQGISAEEQVLIEQTLLAHPQPAYAKHQSEFGLVLGEMNVRWRVDPDQLTVTEVSRVDPSKASA